MIDPKHHDFLKAWPFKEALKVIDYLGGYYLASKLKVRYLKGTHVSVFLPKSCKI